MFDATFSPNRTQTRLHHYTTADGLLGILKSKALWATDIHFLNDQWELTYGHSYIERYLKDKNTQLSNSFLKTMPTDKDETALYATPLSAEQVSVEVGVDRNTIYRWKRAGTIPVRRAGRHLKFDQGLLAEWATLRESLPLDQW